ncbi:hypothetical protein B0H13DRAFT_2312497 [Mycena leptocephala]|nr:hypothetical protein B0H13DRAFT_2312497 [Mycena leptocephala]
MFTPSTEIPPSFRFPPFPLASIEQPEPKISAEPEPDTDTNIFEPTSLEYRAYERLPQPSVDIMTQVARSLPEMLPDPETDSGAIFEDKADDDYVGISISSTPPITSTQSLEILVADRNYDGALRVLDELLEVGTEIPVSFAYESAAISAVKAPATSTTEMDQQIQTFKKWFSLIPPADQSRPRTFRKLRDLILLSPLNSLRLIMEFGLIAAEKGFARRTHFQVTCLVAMYGDPSVTLQFINELRRRNRMFLERTSKGEDVDNLDNTLRVDMLGAAIRTLAQAGRLEHAVQLVPDPGETHFHLTPYTYNFLVHKLEMTKDPRYLPHLKFITQHKSEARFRIMGLKKMEKSRLALAIRCLAVEGHFGLAMGLLPRLDGAEVRLVTATLDFLLAKLREGEDGRHSTYIDHISQLREDTATPSTTAATTSTADNPGKYWIALEALIKAWCLEEALALIPAYHRGNVKHNPRLYTLLLYKLRISYNPKYEPYLERIQRLREHTKQAKRAEALLVQKARAEGEAARNLEDFSGEDIFMSSSVSSSRPPQRIGSNLAASLRALRRALRARHSSQRPHVLTIVRFFEVYLATGRTRAIPLLRNLALRVLPYSYVFAEMLFHARRRNPDLVIQTFVTHFFIVGLPRDELMIRLRSMEELDPATAAIWTATPQRKLFPYPVHTAVVWRAMPAFAKDERALETLYAKLLRFGDKQSTQSSVLHPGVPLLQPPPAWKSGVDASAFTPFIRLMCRAFGMERGGQILKDMVGLGIQPNIYQLTELAMAYSRAGEVRKTMVVLDQVEKASKTWENMEAAESMDAGESLEAEANDDNAAAVRRRALRNHLLPRVDQVFYRAVIRGFLISHRVEAAKQVEQRMRKRFGYVPGQDAQLDNLYKDLYAEERGENPASHPPLLTVTHSTKYQALRENTEKAQLHADDPMLTDLDLLLESEPLSSMVG